ncbi:uncharacterized protein LOC111351899 [Spodoptera litura]|uniref:Uncharacterized protein LOC111351899 n=1 Tax=Spodoptera litura TaxID=69820 RepID=A0A9J7DWH2_SPOLT|nr:uncharacterized protein LOC111351899 [Spodoptera litura]
MFIIKRALLYAFLLAVLLEPILAKRGFSGGHSYPKSGGLSGGGHHSGGLSGGGHGYPSSGSHGYPSSGARPPSHGYPSGGGLSGSGSSGGSHGYPSSGGLSGSGNSGGSHGYPSGGGLSGNGGNHGYPSSGGSHGYPSSGGSHGYPSSGGSHGYPSSGGGLSGNNNNRYPQNKPSTVHHTTNVYNYHYSPPQRISYAPPHGGPPVNYPVYHGTPPTYVYQYKNSGSKYGTLLAGLALLNLGTLAGAAYAHSRTQHYKPQPGEVCKFAVKKDNGDYEETRIDCQIISSFILEDQAQRSTGTNSTVSVVTVTNTTVTNTTNMMAANATPAPAVPVPGNVLYAMLPNGTLVPVNQTAPPTTAIPLNVPMNTSVGGLAPNGTVITSSVVTTTTNTTVVNALDVKGSPVQVTPGMQCFVIRSSPTHNMRKAVQCGLLQTYADKSIRKNSATRNGPMFTTILAAVIAFCIAY